MGIIHEKCYESETLNVSKEDFEEPEELEIIIDCSNKPIEIEDESEDINDLLELGINK